MLNDTLYYKTHLSYILRFNNLTIELIIYSDDILDKYAH
jgi:hypothetical protein